MGQASDELPDAVPGERRSIEGRAGRLGYYVAGAGAPVLLIHSINAAASAYEMRPLFERLSGSRRVYAPDLPGFGISDRSDRDYRVATYVGAIVEMLDLIGREHAGAPVDVVALSLSSEFAARAAREQPGRLRTLALITPTGFERGSASRRSPPGGTREIPGLRSVLNVPLWGGALFGLLASRPSIRFFLEKTWGSKRIDEGAFAYAYLTAHQPGSEHAPYAFVSGRLFSSDIRTLYEALALPVLVMHGTKGDFQDFSEIGWTRERANWRVRAFDTGALVQFEQPDEVVAEWERFVTQPPLPA